LAVHEFVSIFHFFRIGCLLTAVTIVSWSHGELGSHYLPASAQPYQLLFSLLMYLNRTTAVLFDEKQSDQRYKNRVAYVVAHELAHQWFGNLVTMDWWSELWLNEGFATWVGWLAVDKLHPGKIISSPGAKSTNTL
jgi:hypothetical protein